MIINEAWVTQVMPIVYSDDKDEQGNPKWRRQDFKIEFYDGNDRYPDSMALSLFNGKIEEMNLQVQDVVSLSVGHSAREYNGRLHNDLKHYHLKVIKRINQPAAPATGGAMTAPATPPQGMATGATDTAEKPDDLPF